MAEVLLFHHIQGMTDGVRTFADALRMQGHTVHTPDLFEGRVFGSIPDGMAYARETGFDVLDQRADDAAAALPPGLVYAGFSFGVMAAQRLAMTQPGARGALLMCACLPVSEFGDAWPDAVPAQVHGMEGDEFFEEDLAAARELAQSPAAELFLYPGATHLFPDSSLPDYDADATALLLQRVTRFLEAI